MGIQSKMSSGNRIILFILGGRGAGNGGSRWREERRENGEWVWGRRDQGRGRAKLGMCLLVGRGAIQVKLSAGSRRQIKIKTRPQTQALIKALEH